MAGNLFALLTDDDLDLTPAPPEFEALAAFHLGGLQNVESAIDLDLLDTADAVADAPNVLAGLDTEHDELIAQAPEIAQDEATPLLDELDGARQQGDREFQRVDGSLITPP